MLHEWVTRGNTCKVDHPHSRVVDLRLEGILVEDIYL